MTEENLLSIDVAKRTTRGRACPVCGGKIIPSDRAVYQSTGDPDGLFPLWQCERCGYEEMGARKLVAGKTEGKSPSPAAKKVTGDSAKVATVVASTKIPASSPPLLDAKGRAMPPDVKAMILRFGPAPTKEI